METEAARNAPREGAPVPGEGGGYNAAWYARSASATAAAAGETPLTA